MRVRSWNMVAFGRLLAVAVIVSGVVLSILDTRSLDAYGIPHYQLRSFFNESLNYIWLGGLLLALAELGARFGRDEPSGRVDWKLTTLVRVLGATVIAGGISLAVWNARSIPAGNAIRGNAVLGFSSYFQSGSKRTITREAIEYAWHGGLLILAAEIADRLGWGVPGAEDGAPSAEEVAAP